MLCLYYFQLRKKNKKIDDISECDAKRYPWANCAPAFCFLPIEGHLTTCMMAQQGLQKPSSISSIVPLHPGMDGDSTSGSIYLEAGSARLGLWHCLCCVGWQSNTCM